MHVRARWAVAALAGVALALLPRAALAQASDALAGTGGGISSYGPGDWLGLGVRLALVLLAIWAAVVGMRWYVRRMNGGSPGRGRLLHVVESRTLGPNRSLQLLRIGDRAVLLGITPERITGLLAIDDAEEVARLVEAAEADGPAPRSLRGIFAQVSRVAAGARRVAVAAHARTEALRAEHEQRARRTAALRAEITPPAAQRMRASAGYREARVAELQRAIARARGERAR